MLEILLGQIPEAIYFALFMIFAKDLKEKRLLFTGLMVLEYVLILNALPYTTWAHFLIFIITYILLKILYKDKAQVTDIFTFEIASIILIIISSLLYLIIWKTINNYIVYIILNRIILILFFIKFNKKINNIQKLYKKLWNRNDKIKKKIKSTTFRALNIVAFNIMFYIINLGMIFMIMQHKGGV